MLEVLEDVEFDVLDDLCGALLAEISSRSGPATVVVDVTGRFVGLAGVRMLADMSDAAERRGLRLVVLGLGRVWDRALPAAGLDGRLTRVPPAPGVYG